MNKPPIIEHNEQANGFAPVLKQPSNTFTKSKTGDFFIGLLAAIVVSTGIFIIPFIDGLIPDYLASWLFGYIFLLPVIINIIAIIYFFIAKKHVIAIGIIVSTFLLPLLFFGMCLISFGS